MGTPDPIPLQERRRRAATAAAAVSSAFGRRFLGLPGTYLGVPARPWRFGRVNPWHYWWQAQLLDCLIDAAWREYDADRTGVDALGWHRLATRLLRTIKLRNGGRWTNDYYDDMAWLALAGRRLQDLTEALSGRGAPTATGALPRHGAPAASGAPEAYGSRSPKLSLTMLAKIIPQLDSAHTSELGGGLFWHTKRDFKNAPATAPAALLYARVGRRSTAQTLINWLNDYLLDPAGGLYLDGIRRQGGQLQLDRELYTYNQGPILGALLELGGADNLRRAQEVIAAVEHAFVPRGSANPPGSPNQPGSANQPGSPNQPGSADVLIAHGAGDRGLFTGILVRYLALAAGDTRLEEPVRQAAARLVTGTAEALWRNRDERRAGTVFSADPAEPAVQAYPPGTSVELSTQLQAWMILEAAATVP